MQNTDSCFVVGILFVGNHYYSGVDEFFAGDSDCSGDGGSVFVDADYYIPYQNSGYHLAGGCFDLQILSGHINATAGNHLFRAIGGSDSDCSHFDEKYELYHLLWLAHRAWVCDPVHHFDELDKEGESHCQRQGRRKWKSYNLDGTPRHRGVEMGELEVMGKHPYDNLFRAGPFCGETAFHNS